MSKESTEKLIDLIKTSPEIGHKVGLYKDLSYIHLGLIGFLNRRTFRLDLHEREGEILKGYLIKICKFKVTSVSERNYKLYLLSLIFRVYKSSQGVKYSEVNALNFVMKQNIRELCTEMYRYFHRLTIPEELLDYY